MTNSGPVDWVRLGEAYAPAAGLSAQLAALSGTDEDAAQQAFLRVPSVAFATGDNLDEIRFTPATVPILRHFAAAVRDPAFGVGDETIRSTSIRLLGYAAEFSIGAEAAARDQSAADTFDVLPELFAAIWPVPDDWERETRLVAAEAAVQLVRHPALRDRRAEVITYLERVARTATLRREVATHVMGLNRLGVVPRAWIDDRRTPIRMVAALSPAFVTDRAATDLLVRAAEHPRAFERSFAEPFAGPAYRSMLPGNFRKRPLASVIEAVCERVADFRRLRRAAAAAVDVRGTAFAPYLARAFPDGMTADVTYSQAYFARAIAAREDLWDDPMAEIFRAAGLPEERARWRRAGESAGLLEEPFRAVRENPRTFVGTGRTDPDLRARLMELARTTGPATEADGRKRAETDGRTTVEANGRTAFTVARSGRLDPADLLRGELIGPHYGLRVAAALSLGITVYQRVDGIVHRQEFVERVALGPREEVGPSPKPDAYIVNFELDEDWLPDRWWRIQR